MNALTNLSFRNKLLLISAIPIFALSYFVITTVRDELGRREAMLLALDEFVTIEQMSKVLHEVQIERGLALIYVATGDENDQRLMIGQRSATNAAAAALQKRLRSGDHERSRILSFLDSLNVYRKDDLNFSEHANTYKLLLLSEMSRMLRASRSPVIRNHLESHVYLLSSKEYFAQLRSILSLALPRGYFAKGEYGNFAMLKGSAERNYARFLQSATPEVFAFASSRYSPEGGHEIKPIVDSLFNNPAFISGVSHQEWWLHTSNLINLMKEVEDYSMEQIRTVAGDELSMIRQTVTRSIGIAIGVIVVIVFIVSITIRHTLHTVSSIKRAADRIIRGEVDVGIPVRSHDEMGELARSFNQMVAASRDFAVVADTVGKGDYSVDVPVRSETDVLGIALKRMRDNLQRLARDNETRTWLLSGNNTLSDSMRGDKPLAELSKEVINALTVYLDAQIGALYVRNNGHLRLSGSYAFDGWYKKGLLRVGEGLVGQVAEDGKPLVFSDVPDDYIKINSALGETRPRSLLIFPFTYEGEVKGVVEIGSTRKFTKLDLDLLGLVGNNIGIAVHAAQARERMRELLEETQRQAEELESQQEELKQFNEELQEKTELLERSEEELRAQQEELQQTNEELSEKATLLEEQKQELELVKVQIEEKVTELEVVSKYKSEFLANMSHELRTPLNSILILTQIMLENRNNALGEKDIQCLRTIYHSGNDLLNLINQILDLSKIEAGKMELDVEEFGIGEIVRNVQLSFEEVARSKQIGFSIDAPESVQEMKIISDRLRLEQVLKNFLSNAFKFTERNGTVSMKIAKVAKRTDLTSPALRTATSVLMFSVADNGIGIPQEKFELIFGAFQQGDGSTKRKYGGTGLGLSISRELCNLLGGEIQVKSEEGKGSTFTLYLSAEPVEVTGEFLDDVPEPQTGGVVLEIPAPPDPKPARFILEDDRATLTEGDRKILIIEDDLQFASVLLGLVRERQYKGILAHEGHTGLHYARYYKPDAILLDMKLPVVSGQEVLRQLKVDPALRHVPVQIISGYTSGSDGLKRGAFNFLKKPVSRDDIWKALDKLESFVSRKPKRLLIVEDNVQHSLAVTELIGNGDVSCFSAYSASEAYDMLLKTAYDCIIVDLGLPDMSGFQFLERLRDNEKLAKIPVIVYTGKALSKEENARLQELADSVVLKTAHSNDRLLDETTLFLHRVEAKLPKEKQRMLRKLHRTDEVLKGKTVLIADDDVRNLFSLVTVLEQEGMRCLTAENGRIVMEMLHKNPAIDIVLMDVMMPEMDGYETSRAIRALSRFADLPIIALTAKAMKDDREKCLESGMSDYISKPLKTEQLLSLMRVWLYR